MTEERCAHKRKYNFVSTVNMSHEFTINICSGALVHLNGFSRSLDGNLLSWLVEDLLVRLSLHLLLVFPDCCNVHFVPLVNPCERLAMTQQQHFANARVDEMFDLRLESPDFEGSMYELVRAHEWLVGDSPTLNQRPTIRLHTFESLRILVLLEVLRLDLVERDINLVNCDG